MSGIRRLIFAVCYQTSDFLCSVIRRLISDGVYYQTSDVCLVLSDVLFLMLSVIRRLISEVSHLLADV